MYQNLRRPLWTKINEAYLARDAESESELDEDQFNIPVESDGNE